MSRVLPSPVRRLLGLAVRASDFRTVVGAGVIGQALLLISGPLVARMLGPEGRGHLALTLILSALAVRIAAGGWPLAIAQLLAQRGEAGRDLLCGYWRGWIMRSSAAGIASGIAFAFMADYRGGLNSDLALLVVTIVMAVTAGIQLLSGAMLYGEGNARYVTMTQFAPLVVYVLLIVALFFVQWAQAAAVVACVYVIGQVVGIAISWRCLRKPTGTATPIDSAELRGNARRAWGVTVRPAGLGLDQLVIGAMMNPAALGLYVAASNMTNVSAVVFNSISAMLVPKMAARDRRHATIIMRNWMTASLAVGAGIVMLLELLVGPVIRILFGHEFVSAIPAARILVVGWALFSFRNVLASALQAQGRAGTASLLELSTAILLVVGTVIGVLIHGIEGAAASLVILSFAMCVVSARFLRWRVPLGKPTAGSE